MLVRVLGEVGAEVDGRVVDLGGPRQRCVLAALAVDAGRVVPVERLVERVWGVDTAPRSRASLHNYISRLRRVLTDGVTIVHRSGGYALTADSAEPVVDLHRFRALCSRARRDGADVVGTLSEALALWRGEALTGVTGEWARAERDRIGQERLAARHDLIDARLHGGEGGELVAELAALSTRYPLDERVQGQYMLALHRAGRTIDATAHYREVRARLVEELGVEPGGRLRELHQRVLSADPVLTGGPSGAGAAMAVPRQLPMPPAPFVGRQEELAALDAAPDASVLVVGGGGGVGKTWLALHWAHRDLDRFPDGQLFVDLHGFSPTARQTEPEEALRGFLAAFGVDHGAAPPDLDAQSALYRSMVATRRMLVVLDNAATVEQVLPLLPGSPTCTVLVTSRIMLPSLIDRYGARHLPLAVPRRGEALALLRRRLGAERVDAEPGTTDELVELCGRHPLALAITARHAATRPTIPLAEFAAELRDLGLEVLDHDEDPTASLPVVLSWSLRRLTDRQRRVFALLGTAPGRDIDVAAAAALTGLSGTRTRKALRALADHSLLDRGAGGRWSMHDLVRAYAAATARDHLTETDRLAASARVLDFYLHTCHTADRVLNPGGRPFPLDAPAEGAHHLRLPDAAAATAWLDAEYAVLLAVQHTAARQARHAVVWQLAWALNTFQVRRGRLRDNLTTWRAALRAAAHLPDPAPRILAHRRLGHTSTALGRCAEGIEHLRQALALAERNHDTVHEARTHQALARAWERQGDDRRALRHATRALDLHRALRQPGGEAAALNAVGWYSARLGDYDTARARCQAALDRQRDHPDPYDEATALDSLGYIAHHTGRHQEAVDLYRRAVDLFRTIGNTCHAADVLDRLGHPNVALGRHAHAGAAWCEALELYREQGRGGDTERVRRQLGAVAGPGRLAGSGETGPPPAVHVWRTAGQPLVFGAQPDDHRADPAR